MLMKMLVVAFSLWAVGCGSGSATPSDFLQGAWIADPDSATGCSNGVNVSGTDMQLLTVCSLQSGGVGIDVAEGSFNVSGSSIELLLNRASCPASDFATKVVNLTFSATADMLVLSDSAGLVAMRRNAPTGSTVTVKFGCWHADGFTPMPISPL